MMKIISKSLRSNRLIRFLVVFLVFSLVLVLSLTPFVPVSDLNIDGNCERESVTEKYCVFKCSFFVNEDSIGRVVVTHSAWGAIFDQEFNVKSNQTESIDIQLPRRYYTYYLKGGFYNQDKYGTWAGRLTC
jgi:hypothetical protein